MSYDMVGNNLHFDWGEGGVLENLDDFCAGCRRGAVYARDYDTRVGIIIPNQEPGYMDSRDPSISTPTRTHSHIIQRITEVPYKMYIASEHAEFSGFSVPGLCHLTTGMALAVSMDMPNDYIPLLLNLIWGRFSYVARGEILPSNIHLTNSRRIITVLSKKAKAPKSIDFAAVLLALFGERIAAVITKESTY